MKIRGLKVFHINPGKKVPYGTGWGKNCTLVKIYTEEGIENFIDEDEISSMEQGFMLGYLEA